MENSENIVNANYTEINVGSDLTVKVNPHYLKSKLESGLEVEIKTLKKGRDFRQAQRACSDASDLQFALIAQLVKIKGEPLTKEDVLDLDLDDVLELIGLVLEETITRVDESVIIHACQQTCTPFDSFLDLELDEFFTRIDASLEYTKIVNGDNQQ